MFVILCYDVFRNRDPKVRKTALKYLKPVQRSVFEGELTEKSLNNLKREIEGLIKPETDSAVIYCVALPGQIQRQEIGVVTGKTTIF